MPRFTPTPATGPVPSPAPRGPFPPAPPAPGAATAQAAAAGGANPMTLDALLLRQKEIANQQQGAGGLNNGTIFGGLGSMAQQFLGGVRQRGVENEINQAQQDIAGNLAGAFDPVTGEINPQAFGAIGARSPETALQVYQMAMQQRQNAEANRLAEAKLAQDAGGGAWKPSDIAGLRQDVISDQSYKNMSSAMPIYKSMIETAGRDDPLSDLNLVYGLAKIMDPTSVVREGEQIMVLNAQSLPAKLLGLIEKANGKSGFDPPTREGILREAHGRMKSYAEQYKATSDTYRNIAIRNRVNPDDVAPSFGEIEEWKAPETEPPPAPEQTDPSVEPPGGYVVGQRYKVTGKDGKIWEATYTGKGKDANDPANWSEPAEVR